MNTKILVLIFLYIKTSLQDLTTSNNLFAAEIYKHVASSIDHNLLISPFSAEAILALAASGAKGQTSKELRQALHLPTEGNKKSFKNFFKKLRSTQHCTVRTANKIYVKTEFPVKAQFKTDAVQFFLADVENIDFGFDAARTINQWVANQTENKIKNLVAPGVLNTATPALFVNTLYFKAEWIDTDFHKYPTVKKNFDTSASVSSPAEYMVQRGAFLNYDEDEDAHFVELPFREETAKMVVVLPKQRYGLANLDVHKIFTNHNFKKKVVDLEVPMFKFESTVDFRSVLQKMGVSKAFQHGEADFSNIAGSKGDLAVAGVLQKTFIEVNRDGVEAAAATDLWFQTSGPMRTKLKIVLDHPFIFYITLEDLILFVGKVTSP